MSFWNVWIMQVMQSSIWSYFGICLISFKFISISVSLLSLELRLSKAKSFSRHLSRNFSDRNRITAAYQTNSCLTINIESLHTKNWFQSRFSTSMFSHEFLMELFKTRVKKHNTSFILYKKLHKFWSVKKAYWPILTNEPYYS